MCYASCGRQISLLGPICTTAGPTTCYGWAIYDTLFGINAKRESGPQMAEGYTLSDDGRTYLIRLREGLEFHNGERVLHRTACAPGLVRWAARDTLGQTVWQYVESCGVQDDRTVKIVLKQPIPIFIEASRKAAQTPPYHAQHVAKTDPYKQITETVGSGPYRFLADEFVSGAHVPYGRLPIMCRSRNQRSGRSAAKWRFSIAWSGISVPL
jgi:peptide/nickel transport system substrate-binding protein